MGEYGVAGRLDFVKYGPLLVLLFSTVVISLAVVAFSPLHLLSCHSAATVPYPKRPNVPPTPFPDHHATHAHTHEMLSLLCYECYICCPNKLLHLVAAALHQRSLPVAAQLGTGGGEGIGGR